MDIQNQNHLILLKLCHSALEAKIDIFHFYDEWPYDEGKSDIFLKHLYDDLENGIQHTPGSIFTGKVLYDKWRKSEPFRLIQLDKMLLEKCMDTQMLSECRKNIISLDYLNEVDMELAVDACLGDLRRPG
jgi:hypothetical protein